MKHIGKHCGTTVLILLGAVWAHAQTFPPTVVAGPFPKGTEDRRNDAPVDSLRTPSPMIYHEYTCYKVKNPPIIDGVIDSTDSVWSKIPWTLMTFWEAQTTERTITVFSGDTTDTWNGPKDCTGYFKLLWDDTSVYVAVKVYDDIINMVTDTEDLYSTECRMYQHDCIQLAINTTTPEAQVDLAVDPYAGCELGVALATVFPIDTVRDTLDTTLYTIVPDTTKAADTTEVFTSWQPSNANSVLLPAPGDNNRANSTVNGKAIHISVEKIDDYSITRYEFALRRDDSTSGFLWSPFIRDNAVGRFSIMAMDHDNSAVDSLEAVSWASGILTKNFNLFGSIKWSFMTPDGEEFPTAIDTRIRPRSAASVLGLPLVKQASVLIEYTTTGSGWVLIELFDCTGRKVVSLVDRDQVPGTYHVNHTTAGLAVGTYFYRMKINSSELIRKLTVVR
ncbi:MAG: hypothetical protein JW913_18285 [Chitinispirillaceae bacterium]|nr:hypothetical protein [Chitinispirillaceae bacterium]